MAHLATPYGSRFGLAITHLEVTLDEPVADDTVKTRVSPPPPYDVYRQQCPTRQALDRIADKWTALIVGLLEQRPHRFNELNRSIEGISHKVLSQILRSLEVDGLVTRRVLSEKPMVVEYGLTPLGATLTEPLGAVREWAERNIDSILEARRRFERHARGGSVDK